MNRTAFGLKVVGVAALLASSILTVVIVAQRPSGSAVASHSTTTETKLSQK